MSRASLESVNCSQEADMEADAPVVAMFAAMFAAIVAAIFVAFLPLFLSGERSRAAQESARARRIAEARMNARLLRLNI
jgi:hypothetical protein